MMDPELDSEEARLSAGFTAVHSGLRVFLLCVLRLFTPALLAILVCRVAGDALRSTSSGGDLVLRAIDFWEMMLVGGAALFGAIWAASYGFRQTAARNA